MKRSEVIGNTVGALIGAAGTGITIYFTGSSWSSLIGLLGFFIGSWIGKKVEKDS